MSGSLTHLEVELSELQRFEPGSYATEELIGVFDKIKAMKARSSYAVVNPTESLTEMQRRLRKESERLVAWAGTSISIWIGTSTSTVATPGTSRCATFTTSTRRS